MIVLRATENERWNAVLARGAGHDFYHLPGYHRLAEERGEGRAHLFVHSDGDDFVALPLLLRPLEHVRGAAALQPGPQDATSVYGYPGPIASRAVPESVIRQFRVDLEQQLEGMGVVSVFSRLHPLLEQAPMIDGLGEIATIGQTVSIDLTLPAEAQQAGIRKDHREGIRRLHRQGVECVLDADGRHLDEFVELYTETMRRVSATAGFFFDKPYFQWLMTSLGAPAHLFVAKLSGQVIAGGFFIECAGILQYHLSGTRTPFLKLAPMKLILDSVRAWANERQTLRAFHLGGGVGGGEDALFKFKAGFSDRRHPFRVWRWVCLPDAYDALCAARGDAAGARHAASAFFPAYRAP